jgi:hypothetical protein
MICFTVSFKPVAYLGLVKYLNLVCHRLALVDTVGGCPGKPRYSSKCSSGREPIFKMFIYQMEESRARPVLPTYGKQVKEQSTEAVAG